MTTSPWGSEILVNTIAASAQYDSAVTDLANGRFVVTWTDLDSNTLSDTSGAAVHGQVFHADGKKLGAEFLVNTTTPGHQGAAAITALADGRFVATWFDYSAGNADIRAQVFNADGSKSAAKLL